MAKKKQKLAKGNEQQQLRRTNKTKFRGTGARTRVSFPAGTPKAGDNAYFHNNLSVEAQCQIL